MRPSLHFHHIPPAAAALAAALGLGAVASCARPSAPPGGVRDQFPPVVVATRPDTFERVETIGDPLRIVFNERISERPTRGTMDEAVLVSPLLGEIRVDHSGRALEVDMSGGFRPGLVYRVTVFPVIQDLFDNTMREPFEFVFSTGGELHRNAVAGIVYDRITGEPAPGFQVQMRGQDEEDGPVYVARTDTAGIYAFRFMPPGTYTLVAWEDRNRDGMVDPMEVQGQRTAPVGPTDTLLADVVVLAPDTTPARLAGAEVTDSSLIRLTFDDHLEPEVETGRVTVTLTPVPDTAGRSGPPAPAVARILHEHQYEAYRDSLAEAADSADEAEAAADSAGVAPPDRPRDPRLPRGVNVPTAPGRERGTLPEGTPLPSRALFLVLDSVLPPEIPYEVQVTGVINVNRLPGGGGVDTLVRERPPAPDTAGAVPDTTGAVPDTAGAVPDTTDALPDAAGAVADTAGAVPDTTDAVPDAAGAVADTAGAMPDTAGAVPSMSGGAPGSTVAAAHPRGSPPDPGVRPPPDPLAPPSRGLERSTPDRRPDAVPHGPPIPRAGTPHRSSRPPGDPLPVP